MLPPTPSSDSWPDIITSIAKEYMNGAIEVVNIAPGFYDPESDSVVPGVTDTIIPSRAARIQHLRFPLESNGGLQWEGKRRYRFQIELLPNDPEITQGMTVRVLNGGRDATLEGLTFTVLVATNSSHAALRTIEAYGG